MSEDIGLIALAPRRAVATVVEGAVAHGLARSHGRVTWEPRLGSTRSVEPSVLSTSLGVSVQVQLLDKVDQPPWPTEVRPIEQRYGDCAPASLRVLTAAAFGAAKLSAWLDRHAPRDLFDLWALSERGLIDRESVALFASYGPTHAAPAVWAFQNGVTEQAWHTALGHQTRLRVTAADALDVVRRAWLAATDTS